jgi:hypothetical protein
MDVKQETIEVFQPKTEANQQNNNKGNVKLSLCLTTRN